MNSPHVERRGAWVAALLVAGCVTWSDADPRVAQVQEFAFSDGASKIRQVVWLTEQAVPRVVVFRVEWGDPRRPLDCLGSCRPTVYQSRFGLWYEDRIGWLDAYVDPSTAKVFDFWADDEYLTSLAMFELLERTHETLFQQSYKMLLARDVDTPRTGLLLVAQGLYEWIHPGLADALLDHPIAGADCEVVDLIAQVPVFQGDAYGVVRARADSVFRLRC